MLDEETLIEKENCKCQQLVKVIVPLQFVQVPFY